jgi:hypothetical protein
MKWSNRRDVEHLLKKRDEMKLDLKRIEGGMFDATIQGRYQKDAMSDEHRHDLGVVMRRHVERLLKEGDRELKKLGVEIEDDDDA